MAFNIKGKSFLKILDFNQREMRYLLANCGISSLEVTADSVSIVEANVVSHLPEDLITN